MFFVAICERFGIARLLLFASVLFLAFAPFGRVYAAEEYPCTDGQNKTCSISEAYSSCETFSVDHLPSSSYTWMCQANLSQKSFISMRQFESGGWQPLVGYAFYWVGDCPAGTEWFESEQKCLQPCLDRNPSTPPNYGYWTISNAGTSMCKSGYSFSRGDVLETRGSSVCGTGAALGQCTAMSSQVRAVWSYNGEKCSSQPNQPPPPADDDVSCTPATANQTYCILPNGENCYTASSGRMICWKPNEFGSKTDGPVTQTNNNGNQSPNPPPGSSHTSTVTTTTTTNSNSSNTTTITYSTNSGAPAGSSNQGTSTGSDGKPTGGGSGSGSGSGTGGDGGDGDDDDDNTAGGGGNCDSPPITSGDAILGMVATQTWATRCAVEEGNAAKFVGDIGNCKASFSVEGTNANAVKLRAMREQICGPGSVADAGDAFDAQASQATEYGDGDEPPDDEPKDPLEGRKVERDGNWFVNQLDNAGFLGGGSCPADKTFSVGGRAFPLSMEPLCQLLGAISGLIVAVAYLIAFRIMAS